MTIISPGRGALALAALLFSGGIVVAHHGVTGRYDTSTPILLRGVVTQSVFSPPHPVLHIAVEAAAAELPAEAASRADEFTGPVVVRDEDVGQVREVEFSPVGVFYDLRDRLRIGDRVTVVALRNCLPPNQLRSSWIQLAEGEIVSYEGGLHRRVDGC